MIKTQAAAMTIMYPSTDIFGPPSAYSYAPEWLKDKLGPAVFHGYSLEVSISVEPTAADQRFGFDIRKIETPEWNDDRDDKNGQDVLARCRSMSLFQQYLLVIHYTGSVQVSVREPYPVIRVDAAEYPDNIPEKLSPAWVKYLVYRVDRGVDANGERSRRIPFRRCEPRVSRCLSTLSTTTRPDHTPRRA